jgi:hypothetical protein
MTDINSSNIQYRLFKKNYEFNLPELGFNQYPFKINLMIISKPGMFKKKYKNGLLFIRNDNGTILTNEQINTQLDKIPVIYKTVLKYKTRQIRYILNPFRSNNLDFGLNIIKKAIYLILLGKDNDDENILQFNSQDNSIIIPIFYISFDLNTIKQQFNQRKNSLRNSPLIEILEQNFGSSIKLNQVISNNNQDYYSVSDSKLKLNEELLKIYGITEENIKNKILNTNELLVNLSKQRSKQSFEQRPTINNRNGYSLSNAYSETNASNVNNNKKSKNI